MKKFALLVLCLASFGFAQSATLSLVNPASPVPATYQAGAIVPLNITKTGNPTATGLQFNVSVPPNTGSVTFTASAAALTAGKVIACSGPNCILVGLNNATPIPDGTVVIANVTLATAPASNPVIVTLSSIIETDGSGTGLATLVGNPTVSLLIKNQCDVNNDGLVSAVDTSAVLSMFVSGGTSPSTDLDSNGTTDVRDAQIVATAASPSGVCNKR